MAKARCRENFRELCPQPGASAANPQLYNNVSVRSDQDHRRKWYGCFLPPLTRKRISRYAVHGDHGVTSNVSGKPNLFCRVTTAAILISITLPPGPRCICPCRFPAQCSLLLIRTLPGQREVALTAIEGLSNNAAFHRAQGWRSCHSANGSSPAHLLKQRITGFRSVLTGFE